MLAALVGCAFITAITLDDAATRAPDQAVVIASERVFTKPMAFPHSNHKEYKCTECHHDYMDAKNVWQEGQEVKLCNVCHKLQTVGKIMNLEKAYHDKCQGCHKKLKKEKKKTGPTSCSKCHLGAADEGEAK
jgi:hypothetical protein